MPLPAPLRWTLKKESRPCPRRCGLLVLGCALLLGARAQTLSLTLKDAPLGEALRLIEAQSPYRFVYTREELSGTRLLTLQLRDVPVDSLLAELLRGQGLVYQRLDQFIILKKDPDAPAPTLWVSGVVRDSEGHPVAGASIQVGGTARGTVADEGGYFTLTGVERGSTLSVTAVGYHPLHLPAQETLTAVLDRLVSALDETVVIGYGSTTRRKATGSVGRLAGGDLQRVPSTAHPLLALKGKAAGVWLRPSSGLSDAPLTVRIRGQHSLQNGTSPLYLVDGIPFLMDGTALSQRSGLQAMAPFQPVHPDELQSIEVLRDGAATAIYGSRGAGGVVLLTTRAPQEGRPEGAVGLRRGWSRAGLLPRYLSTPEYLALRREAFQNDGVRPTPERAPDLTVWDSAREVRWKELLTGGVTPSLEAYARYGGGRGGTAYRLSATYGESGTVFPGSFKSTRATVMAQGSRRSRNNQLQARATLGGHRGRYRLPAQDLTAFVALPPNMYTPYDRTGALRWEEGGYRAGNPLAVVHQPFTAGLEQLSAGGTLSYGLHPRLRLQVLWGGHRLRFDEELLVPIASQDPSGAPKGSASFGKQSASLWVGEPSLSGQLPLGRRTKSTVLLGATLQETTRESLLVTGSGYRDDALLSSLSHAPQLSVSRTRTHYRYSGVYGRLSAEHRDKYLLEGTARRDGSSRFGPGRQFALFGAVGAGWILSREPWVRRALPSLSYAKLRVSYGAAGNDAIGDHRFRDTWSPDPYPYGGGSSWRVRGGYNPAFGWEVTRKWEAALEWGLLQDRLLFSVAWYRHRSANQILRYPVAAQTGFTSVVSNAPVLLQNGGLEGEVSFRSRPEADLSWMASGHLTLPRSRLLRFPGLEQTVYAATYQVGRPLDSRRGYRFRGVNESTGQYLFEDVNGDGVLDVGDQGYTGTMEPRLFGGTTHSWQWKGWRLSTDLYFAVQKGPHPVYASATAPGDGLNFPLEVVQRWRVSGDRAPYGRATQDPGSEAYAGAALRAAHSSAALTDASFVRLQCLQLSYSRPTKQQKRLLRRWECFVQGDGLVTLSGYRGGDPESQSATTLPPLRTVETGFKFFF